MNKLIKNMRVVAISALLLAGASNSPAQQFPPNWGNIDVTQIRQQIVSQFRDLLEIKNDDEWKIVQDRIEKVFQARIEVMASAMGGMNFGRRGGRGGFNMAAIMSALGMQQNQELEALQSCLDANASHEVIKARLNNLREATKAKQAKLDQSQELLRQVLTLRQEAQAVVEGLLD